MKFKGISDQGFSRLARAVKSQTEEDYEEFDLTQSEPAEDYEEFDFAQSEPEEYEKQEKYPGNDLFAESVRGKWVDYDQAVEALDMGVSEDTIINKLINPIAWKPVVAHFIYDLNNLVGETNEPQPEDSKGRYKSDYKTKKLYTDYVGIYSYLRNSGYEIPDKVWNKAWNNWMGVSYIESWNAWADWFDAGGRFTYRRRPIEPGE